MFLFFFMNESPLKDAVDGRRACLLCLRVASAKQGRQAATTVYRSECPKEGKQQTLRIDPSPSKDVIELR